MVGSFVLPSPALVTVEAANSAGCASSAHGITFASHFSSARTSAVSPARRRPKHTASTIWPASAAATSRANSAALSPPAPLPSLMTSGGSSAPAATMACSRRVSFATSPVSFVNSVVWSSSRSSSAASSSSLALASSRRARSCVRVSGMRYRQRSRDPFRAAAPNSPRQATAAAGGGRRHLAGASRCPRSRLRAPRRRDRATAGAGAPRSRARPRPGGTWDLWSSSRGAGAVGGAIRKRRKPSPVRDGVRRSSGAAR